MCVLCKREKCHFWQASWILTENKKYKYLGNLAISSEFLAHRVVQGCPIENGNISIFATYGGHLGF